MYCNPNDLAEAIRSVQDGERPSNELIEMAYAIADGVYKLCNYRIDLDDYKQECVILLLKKIPRIDTTQNCFSYVTQVFKMKAVYMAKRKIYDYKIKIALVTGQPLSSILPPEPKPKPKPVKIKPKAEKIEKPPKPKPEPKPKPAKIKREPKPRTGRSRTARKLIYQGSEYTITQLAKMKGLGRNTVLHRLAKYDGDAEKALDSLITKGRPTKKAAYQGCEYTVAELSSMFGRNYQWAFRALTANDWDAEKAFQGIKPNEMCQHEHI